MGKNIFESEEYKNLVRAGDRHAVSKLIKRHVNKWWQYKMVWKAYKGKFNPHKRYKLVLRKIATTKG